MSNSLRIQSVWNFRRIATLLAVCALVLAPLSAAQASSKYKVTLDSKVKLVDVYYKTGVKMTGRVSGGKVAGKRVQFYVTNLDASHPKRKYLGSAKLSTKGKFSKTYRPTRGGRQAVEVVKTRTGSTQAGTKTRTIFAYQWTDLKEFYVSGTGVEQITAKSGDAKETTGPGKPVKGAWGFSESFTVMGGGHATFDARGHQCKKFSGVIGVSNKSEGRTATYSLTVDGKWIQGSKKSKGDKPDEGTNDRMTSGFLKLNVDGPPNVRYIAGLPKVFCTYPSEGAGLS